MVAPKGRKRRRRGRRWILGLGLDGEDGHLRMTKGANFRLIGGSEETHGETSGEGGFEGKIGWGPFSVSMHGKVSHKSEQTRKTDTRAKYSIHTALKRQGPPESLSRVIDFLTDAATKPVVLESSDKMKEDTIAHITNAEEEAEKKKDSSK